MAQEPKATPKGGAPKATGQGQPAKGQPVKGSEKKEAPKMVELKTIAERAGVEPREARAILRSMGIRSEDQKRARWEFPEKEAPAVVAKIKKAIEEKAAKKAEEAEEPEEE